MLRKLNGNRRYIITATPITSGDELEHQNELDGMTRDLRGIGAA